MAPTPDAQQHGGRLAEGELPGPDDKGEHKADEEVVEEFQRIADDRGGDDLLLVTGQTRLTIENLEHGVSPGGACSFCGRTSRLHAADAKTLRCGRRQRQVPGLPVETHA